MRIAIDLQGIQSEGSRKRGIGRYSKEIVKAIILESSENEYILVANSSLLDVRSDFYDLLVSFKNLTYFRWSSPCPLDYLSKNDITFTVGTYLRSYAFSKLHVDLVLITSYFEGFTDNCLLDLDKEILKVPVLSIFYDVIPLINPELYLNHNPDFSRFYYKKLNKMKNLDGLLAISQSSYKEVINHLDFNSECVFNISSACDPEIFNTNKVIDETSRIDLKSITPYILYSGASDPRKNVKSLLHAYSLISPELLVKYKLVLVGKLLQAEINLILRWIQQYSLDSINIHLLGYVSDKDLALLYRNCSLFVFPSLHEGFGLPVLEAMACGAPVIGSNSTSVPEIIGNKQALFDPNSVVSIKTLIEKALKDTSFHSFLIQNSKERSKLFSWSKSAKKALEAFQSFSKESILIKKSIEWQEIKNINDSNLNLLIDKISKIKFLDSKSKPYFLDQVSAAIDLINRESSIITRSLVTQKSNFSWRIEGPIDSNYSLSILNRCFFLALSKLSLDVTLKITEGLGDYEPDLSFLAQYPDLLSCYQESKNLKGTPDIISRNLYPPRVSDLSGKINLMHSYGWEESEFPIEWVHDFNSYLQGISVMSTQVKKILIDNGIQIPIMVSGLGLDHILDIKTNEEFLIKAKKYKILHISSCFPRKSIDILIKAFENTFTINDDVSLIIKTFDNPHNKITNILDECRINNNIFPDVVVINQELNDSELRSLYLQSNVLVAPSRGEGFGLPIGEAMLLGLPVITTAWGGQLDFCNNENSWLIDYNFALADTHFDLDMSFWAEPSLLHLSNLLQTLFSASQDEILEKTIIAKQDISKFTWDTVANKTLHFSNAIVQQNSIENTKIGWVTTWNTKCGIASYSKHLIENIDENIVVFSPLGEDSSSFENEIVRPLWELESSAKQDFKLLVNEIKSLGITSLVIQFNYGFFDFTKLTELIEEVTMRNINLILFMHSTKDPEDNEFKKLELILSPLKKCTRILVHTIEDLNQLKNYGLVNNVTLFPHGILDFDVNKDNNDSLSLFSSWSKRKTKIISSYGFCLPNKGFHQLIMAIKILKDRKFPVKLNLYTAIYDNYYYVYEELLDLIKSLSLEDFVDINNEYMSDEDSLICLSKSDLIVFPYQYSNESSSASVRHGLATKKPIIVTPLDIFNDISDVVFYFSGYSPDDISDGVFNWFQDYDSSPDKITKMNNKKSRIIKNRLFSRLGYRLSAMIKSLEINNR